MPASKVNYIILYKHDPQVYGSASKEVALNTLPPDGFELEDKLVYFVSVEPDTGEFIWRRLSQEEVVDAANIAKAEAIAKKAEKEKEKENIRDV